MNKLHPFLRIALGTAALGLGLNPLAVAACRIGILAELHVSLVHGLVVANAEVDHKPARMLIDTGSDLTFVWSDGAQRLGLPVKYIGGLKFYGVGGQARVAQTVLEQLQIGAMHANTMHLPVISSGAGRTHDADFVLGDDVLTEYAIEFDLAHGIVRILRPNGCAIDELPYWTTTYSQADLERGGGIVTRVIVNGKAVDASLDSGSSGSVITRRAAERAGVTPWITHPSAAGAIIGVGGRRVKSWEGRFDSFSIGDETIRHVPLQIANLFGADKAVHVGSHIPKSVGSQPDMIIGIDFFMAHHLLLLPRKHKLLFTYLGGSVFRVRVEHPSAR